MRALLIASLLLSLVSVVHAQPPDLLLYAPLDGSGDAAFARGDARQQGGLLSFASGLRGQAVSLSSDCLYPVAGNFSPQAGTVTVWLRPHWGGADPVGHYVFCLYGQRDLPQSWAINRWSVLCGGGQCQFTIYDSQQHTFSVSGPIRGWQAGEWHHVAVTWANVNSGRPDAEMKLYLDGALVGNLTGKQIDVGPTDRLMALGRDQDGSPDYGDADADDLFIYGRALPAEEIKQGVDAARQSEYKTAAADTGSRVVRDWWKPDGPFRAEVEWTAEEKTADQVFLQCPLRVGGDLSALGISGAVDLSSVRVVERSADETGKTAWVVLPSRIEDGVVEWQSPGLSRAGYSRLYCLHFRTVRYAFPQPLVSQRLVPPADDAPTPPPRVPDYATVMTGKPWDFDDGSFAGIDQWGNKPEYLRNRKVENGILSMDVTQDPWFIWGDMWGQVDATNQKVAIDLDKFPVLEMKVRQSVPQAKWELYGRVGASTSLLHHDFTVSGSGWQRIRIDLRQDAHWRGVLAAFRIDPTQGVADAHIEIDWVRLLAVTPVEHGTVETLGNPSGEAKTVALTVPKTTVVVGTPQEVTVTVRDATGQPVSGQPVRVALLPGSGGSLQAAAGQRSLALSPQERRALSDAEGRIAMRFVASRRAGPAADTLAATAEFASVASPKTAVNTTPGPPHHYRVEPAEVVTLKPAAQPLDLSAQLVDEFDNSIADQRTLKWEPDGEATVLKPATRLDAKGCATATWRGDESKRWVYHVLVTDDKGLTGESAAICLLPSRPRTDPIVLGPNGYFRRGQDGPGWLPLGGFYANWVGLPDKGEEGRRLISFADATEEQLNHWLDFLAAQGATAMRFMLRAHTKQGMEPMDIIGRVNIPLFAKVLRYMDLARRHDIKFLLVIHEDYTKPAYYNLKALETFCLPQYAGEDLDRLPPHQRRFIRDRKLIGAIGEKYTDPDVMACQDQYTRELLGLLKDNPQLFGWEFENEMVDCPQSWARHMAGVIRSADSVTPICASHGGGGLHTGDPLWWTKRGGIDFYTYHLYPHRGSTSPEVDYGAAVDVLTTYGRMAGVCMLGEAAGDEFGYYPQERDADRRYLMRDIIWFSLVNGNPGCFFWNARGFEVEQFRLAQQITSGLDFAHWKSPRAEVAVVVDHPWEDDKYYRSPQGKADYWMMGRYAQHYRSRGEGFDFAMSPAGYAETADLKSFAPPQGSGPLAVTPGWQAAALQDVSGQGLAYIRNFAGIRRWEVPGKADMFLRDRQPAPLTIVFRLPQPNLRITVVATDLDTGEEKRFEVVGGGQIELGITDHDWALVWKPRE